MKKIFIIVFCCYCTNIFAQVGYSAVNLQDSLKKLATTKDPNSQVDIFRDSKHLMMSVADGYNVCIFAYGQTGNTSWKCYCVQ